MRSFCDFFLAEFTRAWKCECLFWNEAERLESALQRIIIIIKIIAIYYYYYYYYERLQRIILINSVCAAWPHLLLPMTPLALEETLPLPLPELIRLPALKLDFFLLIFLLKKINVERIYISWTMRKWCHLNKSGSILGRVFSICLFLLVSASLSLYNK